MIGSLQEEYIPGSYAANLSKGETSWQAPSNIALVKYWGKHQGQIPANASLSFTLSNSITKTSVSFQRKSEGHDRSFSFEFLFHGAEKKSFHPKLLTFFERVEKYLPFLRDYHLKITSENSFPHSSGIASSASGMAALASCLVDFEDALQPENKSASKPSFIARLGSGSACRSIEGPVVHWGKHPELPGSSDLVGTAYTGDVHPVFRSYRDTILIVEEGVKAVSSSEGHRLMDGHPFAEKRFDQAAKNLAALLPILASGDLSAFSELVELEALSLHAMMMTSTQSYLLMQPNTLEVINRVRQFRTQTGNPLCFTLDAGANVHLLYPAAEEEIILQFIKSELIGYCQDGAYICDQVGTGASKIR